MNIVAFTFARGGSKGVPGKNIRPINGKPLIARAIEAALAAPSIEKVFVSTDSQAIAEVARQHGAEVPFMRPAELASDSAPEWLAWQHAITSLRESGIPIELMVSVPATAPLRSAEDVENTIQALLNSDADVALTVTPADANPYFSMVTLNEAGFAQLAIQPEGQVMRRQDAPKVYTITTVAYAVKADFVLKHQGLFEGRVVPVVVPQERALDIDTEFDFKVAELLLTARET